MEVRVRERLIGALVLVAIVVLVVPAILKGRGPAPAEPPAPLARRVEMPLGDGKPVPEEQAFVPEPELPGAVVPEPDPAPSTAPAGPPPEAPATAAPRSADPPAAKPATRETAKQAATKPPTTKPAAARQAAAKPPPPAAGPATAWAVQLGAFSSREKADKLVAELRKRRFAAFILEYRASGQVLYRVRVGPEQDRARAEEIASRLAKDGFQPVVARHP
jgi:DedD protein